MQKLPQLRRMPLSVFDVAIDDYSRFKGDFVMQILHVAGVRTNAMLAWNIFECHKKYGGRYK